MNTARNIATARNQWRQAMTEARIDVAKVDDQAVAVWPLAAGKSARYAFALASRQASPDTAAGFWITVASLHQLADLLAVLGAMEWKISHGPIISLIPGDMHGEIAGRKRAGTAAFELFNGPNLSESHRVKPNKPRPDRGYLTGPALGQGNSVRSESGRGRVEYSPCWNESAPWISYYNGTAGRSFKTIGDAARHFRDHYRDPLELPDLAAALEKGPIKIGSLTLEKGATRYLMRDERSGQSHSLEISETNPMRLAAHWLGFVSNAEPNHGEDVVIRLPVFLPNGRRVYDRDKVALIDYLDNLASVEGHPLHGVEFRIYFSPSSVDGPAELWGDRDKITAANLAQLVAGWLNNGDRDADLAVFPGDVTQVLGPVAEHDAAELVREIEDYLNDQEEENPRAVVSVGSVWNARPVPALSLAGAFNLVAGAYSGVSMELGENLPGANTLVITWDRSPGEAVEREVRSAMLAALNKMAAALPACCLSLSVPNEWHGRPVDRDGLAAWCGRQGGGDFSLALSAVPGGKLAVHWVTGPRPVAGLEAGILADARTGLHEGGTLDPDEPAEPVRRA